MEINPPETHTDHPCGGALIFFFKVALWYTFVNVQFPKAGDPRHSAEECYSTLPKTKPRVTHTKKTKQ